MSKRAGKLSSPRLAQSSFSLMRSQFSRPFSTFIRTSTQDPCMRSPRSTNFSSPSFRAFCGSGDIGAQSPRSQSMTVPPPYSPLGMVPSNSA